MDKLAFISVFHKDGIDKFAQDLVGLGWAIMASGGTAKYLKDKGIECLDLATLVGEPILGHRVVSLSREFYAMLLARPENADDVAELKKLNLPFISLVCCDMYPLTEEVSKKEATLESVIEKTDIGGPTMLRAAAKGGRIVVCDVNDREKVIQWLKDGAPDEATFKRALAGKAEFTVAQYCMTSATYLSDGKYKGIVGEKEEECCYGENAYQAPSYVYQISDSPFAPDKFKLLTETPLSYNNFCDRDKVMQMITHVASGYLKNFSGTLPHIAIAVKHGNACGVGLGDNPMEAIQKMIEGDVKAIHGGSIFTNFKIGDTEADALIHFQTKNDARRLLDTVTAPSFSLEAIEILARKKGKCRIVVNANLANLNADSLDKSARERGIRDGFITQPNYTFVPDFKEAVVESSGGAQLTEQVIKDLVLAWAIGCTSNSNTITIVKNGKLLGNGVGQQDRVGAAKLAIARADDAHIALTDKEEPADLKDTVAYSDSFFPFPDGPKVLTDRGIRTIFATSGSVNDSLVIEACKGEGATLVMFPDKIARGFAWH